MIKYRLGFTIGAETLFGLLARVLPIEDLSVEEIPPTPAKVKPNGGPSQLAKPAKQKRGRRGNGPDLKRGANAIIMELFSDSQSHRAIELKSLFEKRGLSANGVGSVLEKLKKRGLVAQPEMGLWRKAR